MTLDEMLDAITRADYEGTKEVTVSVQDLVLLKKAYQTANQNYILEEKKFKQLKEKFDLYKILNKPKKLDYYA